MFNHIKIPAGYAMLITRVIIGAIFLFNGWMKVTDLGNMVNVFGSMGIPAFLTYIVSFGELIGGILLILGLWTGVASAFLSIVMIVAVALTFPMGFQMYALPLITLSALVSILGNGAGKFAVKMPVESNL